MGWHGVSQATILDFTLSKQIPRYSDPALNAANPIRNEELLEGLAQMRQDREARRPSDPANTGPGGLGSPRQGDSGWGSRARGANQGDVGNNAGGAAGGNEAGGFRSSGDGCRKCGQPGRFVSTTTGLMICAEWYRLVNARMVG